MNTISLALRTIVAALSLVSFTGCLHCRTCPESSTAIVTPVPEPEIQITGQVPGGEQALKLPPASLTLREAVDRAGGFVSADKKVHPSDCLVGLHRKFTDDDATYFFPLAMVNQ